MFGTVCMIDLPGNFLRICSGDETMALGTRVKTSIVFDAFELHKAKVVECIMKEIVQNSVTWS